MILEHKGTNHLFGFLFSHSITSFPCVVQFFFIFFCDFITHYPFPKYWFSITNHTIQTLGRQFTLYQKKLLQIHLSHATRRSYHVSKQAYMHNPLLPPPSPQHKGWTWADATTHSCCLTSRVNEPSKTFCTNRTIKSFRLSVSPSHLATHNNFICWYYHFGQWYINHSIIAQLSSIIIHC